MSIEIIALKNGFFAYRVGGVYQEFSPTKDGFEPMTEPEAIEQATIVAARMGA